MRVGVIGWPRQETNAELAAAWRDAGVDAVCVSPAHALRSLRHGDIALGRLDVLRTLDGVEPGLRILDAVARAGVRVLNRPAALLRTHDKLETAWALDAARVPHPRTVRAFTARDVDELSPPYVVKPRFGSWGSDVFRCASRSELARCLVEVSDRTWFARHGALVQQLVRHQFYDLRVIVAGGRIAGAARRDAAPGDWRTNLSLGGTLAPARLDQDAREVALAAAAAVGADLVGVDLLPTDEGYVVIELNGAVDFDRRYSLPGADVYADVASALGLWGGSVDRDVRDLSA